MSDKNSNRKVALVQVFSGIGMGLLVGIIVGLSVSEVVSIILGALAALLAAFLGLQDHQSSKKEVEDTALAINKSIMTGLRAGSFGVSCVLAILFGIFLRTHNVLSADTSLKEQIEVWTKAGYEPIEAKQYVVYQNLGIQPKTMQVQNKQTIGSNDTAISNQHTVYQNLESISKSKQGGSSQAIDLNRKAGLGVLYNNDSKVSYCNLLSFERNFGSTKNVLKAYKGTKQESLVKFANEIENNFSEESQKNILKNVETIICEMQECIYNITKAETNEKNKENLKIKLKEMLFNL